MMKTAVLEKKHETAIEMAARTIVLIVTFSGIGNRRKVDTSRVQVDADKELIAVSKQLFESEALWEIQALDSEARRYIESRALPSMLKKGVYLLPLELVTEVETKLSEYAAQRHMFADKLKETYDEAVNQSKKRLRDLENRKGVGGTTRNDSGIASRKHARAGIAPGSCFVSLRGRQEANLPGFGAYESPGFSGRIRRPQHHR